jgi:hypothetical protein
MDFAENARSVFLFLIRVRGYGTGTPFLAERPEVRQAFFGSSKFSSRLHSITGYFHANDPGKPEPGFASFRFRDSSAGTCERKMGRALPAASLIMRRAAIPYL